MLLKVRLQNFRKHEDLTVNFTAGINAIRAPNEAGKTSLLEAISYALFGATKGLKESIEDVVTYGLPVAKLCVELDFDHAGVVYAIKRSTKGAELTFGKERVTGQSEVTRFVEKLFGTSADMAAKLMLAKQKGLGGALSGGPTAAGKMIEDLAGIDLIDQLVDMMQSDWAVGNTSAAEERVRAATERALPVAAADTSDLQAAVTAAEAVLKKASAGHKAWAADLDMLDVAAANAILADQKRLSAAVGVRSGKMLELKAWTTAELPQPPAAGAIDALRDKVQAQKGVAAAAKIHAELKAANIEELWDNDLASLEKEIADAQAKAGTFNTLPLKAELQGLEKADILAANKYRVALAQLEGRLIKETTCALCQKDLSDVPEVVTINSQVGQKIMALKAAEAARAGAAQTGIEEKATVLKAAEAAAAEHQQYLKDLDDVMKAHLATATLYARAGDNITLNAGGVPHAWTWVGPTEAPQDFAGELAALEKADRDATAATAARAQQQIQLDGLLKDQATDQAALEALQVQEAQETLEEAAALAPKIAAATLEVQQAERTLRAAEAALLTAEALGKQAAQQQEVAVADLAKAEADLVTMRENNALIKKVRSARPALTDKLWTIVLAAVTTYFSEVRGFQSTITRADNGFRVNGAPVTGLSGSAEDVLGLSIRLALTKCFLPNIDFLNLDEVAAACDDQREVAMLGLLATAGFKQVVLVTHSPLIDAFADNIITI